MSFSVRTRKFMVNPLLKRKQMIVDVEHAEKASVSKKDLAVQIGKDFKVKDTTCIQLFGFRTAFGGGRSTGFCLIYNDLEALKKYEPKYRLRRKALEPERTGSAKQKKERKNKLKKLRSKAKREAQQG